jgi:hypothetical protein
MVYLVFGETGEYCDFDKWVVKAFTTELDAKTFAFKLNQFAKMNGSRTIRTKEGKRLDKNYDSKNTYYVEEVELESK